MIRPAYFRATSAMGNVLSDQDYFRAKAGWPKMKVVLWQQSGQRPFDQVTTRDAYWAERPNLEATCLGADINLVTQLVGWGSRPLAPNKALGSDWVLTTR